MFDELSATLFLKIVAVIFGAALGIVGILAEHDNNKPLTNKTKAVIFGIGASLIIGVLVTLAESVQFPSVITYENPSTNSSSP